MRAASLGSAMLTLLLGFTAILVPEVAGGSGAATQATNASNVDHYVPYQGERFDVFDWSLCKNLAKKHGGNMLISPISVKIALILLFEGASGQTEHELAGALHLPASRAMIRDRFSLVIRSLQTVQPEYNFDISTRLFFDSSVNPQQSYGAVIRTYYSTEIAVTNMTDAEVSLGKINQWVSHVTHGHVKGIVTDAEELKSSVMLVLNALYFMGTWRQPFQKNLTRFGSFFTDVTQRVEVPYMSTTGRYYYTDSATMDAQILRLPYVGHKFAMYIVLPHARAGLRQLLQDINPFVLRRQIEAMEETSIDVTIPKFKFEFTSHLEAVLRELGVRDIFDNTASFPKIYRGKKNGRRLSVSDFVQKAGVEVDEVGTTAFAVTEVSIGNKIGDTAFHATHPFLFFIEDETTGTVAFVGKVTNPLETTGILEEPVPEEVLGSRIGQAEASIAAPGKTKG